MTLQPLLLFHRCVVLLQVLLGHCHFLFEAKIWQNLDQTRSMFVTRGMINE